MLLFIVLKKQIKIYLYKYMLTNKEKNILEISANLWNEFLLLEEIVI